MREIRLESARKTRIRRRPPPRAVVVWLRSGPFWHGDPRSNLRFVDLRAAAGSCLSGRLSDTLSVLFIDNKWFKILSDLNFHIWDTVLD